MHKEISSRDNKNSLSYVLCIDQLTNLKKRKKNNFYVTCLHNVDLEY